MAVPVAAAHAFVADLDAPELDEEDHHHLTRVLRLRSGEAVTVTDGAGAWRLAHWTGAALEVDGPVEHLAEAATSIAIGFALTKGEKPEFVVQKLTELGVDTIVAFGADRSVTRWEGDRLERNRERLAKVARAAAMQSRRCRLPALEIGADFAELATRPGVALADRDGAPPSLDRPLVLVGPEGGWTERERGLVDEHVGLGDGILRAETAAITIGALLTALRAGIVRPS